MDSSTFLFNDTIQLGFINDFHHILFSFLVFFPLLLSNCGTSQNLFVLFLSMSLSFLSFLSSLKSIELTRVCHTELIQRQRGLRLMIMSRERHARAVECSVINQYRANREHLCRTVCIVLLARIYAQVLVREYVYLHCIMV